MSELVNGATNSQNQVGASAIESSWLPTANAEASKFGNEVGKQEGLSARLSGVAERLKKVQPSSKIAEKSVRFLLRQADKQDRWAQRRENRASRSINKADTLTARFEKQTGKVDSLQEKVANRVKSSEQARNMQMYAEKEGLNVKIKDKTNWFDRTVVNAFDKLRIKWNEALADRNASRAEGRLQNARAYQSSAEQLREVAQTMRGQYAEAIKNNLASSSTARTSELQSEQADLSGQLNSSSNEAQRASDRLNYARNEMPDVAREFATEAKSSDDVGDVMNRFSSDAGKGLDSAGSNNAKGI